MSRPEKLHYGGFYHIYNRGNDGEILFREKRNYRYFLELYTKYVEPVAKTYAYCLLRNHFHFLVRIKDYTDLELTAKRFKPGRAFSNLFSTYTKAFNKSYERTGSLFEKPFHRKLVDNSNYFNHLVVYIHQNPQKHGFVKDFRDWPFSSYRTVLSEQATRLQRETVLTWFDGRGGFTEAHMVTVNEIIIEPLIADDWL